MPQRWGLWLAIEGDLRFLSHHECLRAIGRAAARAELPLQYSQGFNPHPILSLVCPRPVGVASRDDLVVAALAEPAAPDALVGRMNQQAPRGMRFLRARMLESGEDPRVRAARYEWPARAAGRDDLRCRLAEFQQAASWPVLRRTPTKRRKATPPTRTIDLKPLVADIALDRGVLRWTLAPREGLWARPAEVLEALGLDGRVDLAAVVRTSVDYAI